MLWKQLRQTITSFLLTKETEMLPVVRKYKFNLGSHQNLMLHEAFRGPPTPKTILIFLLGELHRNKTGEIE